MQETDDSWMCLYPYESIEELSPTRTQSPTHEGEPKFKTKKRLYDKSNMSPDDLTLDEKFKKIHQRLSKSSQKFHSDIINPIIKYAEVQEVFPPEHLLPIIPEESSLEIEHLTAAALSSVEAFFPRDVAVIQISPFIQPLTNRILNKDLKSDRIRKSLIDQPQNNSFSDDQSFWKSHQVTTFNHLCHVKFASF